MRRRGRREGFLARLDPLLEVVQPEQHPAADDGDHQGQPDPPAARATGAKAVTVVETLVQAAFAAHADLHHRHGLRVETRQQGIDVDLEHARVGPHHSFGKGHVWQRRDVALLDGGQLVRGDLQPRADIFQRETLILARLRQAFANLARHRLAPGIRGGTPRMTRRCSLAFGALVLTHPMLLVRMRSTHANRGNGCATVPPGHSARLRHPDGGQCAHPARGIAR